MPSAPASPAAARPRAPASPPAGAPRRGWARADAARTLADAQRLSHAIDSTLATLSSSPTLRGLAVTALAATRVADSTRARDDATRARVAHAAVTRALAALDVEREGLDYAVAIAAYAVSARLDHSDSTAAATAADPRAALDAASEDPRARQWRTEAIEALRAFLEGHPQSAARAEMRFRLADQMRVEARQPFREHMAHFVQARSAGAAPPTLPVLDAEPALALYQTMLREDRDFAHLDAVLFNAGMILADGGDAHATAYFQELVAQHSDSRYAQESWLRMGDAQFDDHQYAACVPLFEHAAQGTDPSLRAIALYKLGWAHFREDRFVPAADAFRAILDLDSTGTRLSARGNLHG